MWSWIEIRVSHLDQSALQPPSRVLPQSTKTPYATTTLFRFGPIYRPIEQCQCPSLRCMLRYLRLPLPFWAKRTRAPGSFSSPDLSRKIGFWGYRYGYWIKEVLFFSFLLSFVFFRSSKVLTPTSSCRTIKCVITPPTEKTGGFFLLFSHGFVYMVLVLEDDRM